MISVVAANCGANIEIIFVSCKVCNFTAPNSARLTATNRKIAGCQPVRESHWHGFNLWKNAAMKIFQHNKAKIKVV
jgi:hypothetical protein